MPAEVTSGKSFAPAGSSLPMPAAEAGVSASRVIVLLNLALLLLVLPFLLYDALRLGSAVPIGYNEGWNAYAASRLLQGRALYPPLTDGLPVAPVNYPPVSFVLAAAVARLTGHLVLGARCLAFAALLFVGILVSMIVRSLQRGVAAAVLGGLLWLALVVSLANGYVGRYDPQMLGQVFSVGALALYVHWGDRLAPRRIGVLGFLCAVALFINPVLVAVPLALAAVLLLRGRTQFFIFASTLAAIALAMLLGSRLVFGPNLLPNLLVNRDRFWEFGKVRYVFLLTLAYLSVLPLFVPLFLVKIRKRHPLPLIYFLASLLVAGYFFGLDGAAENMWFDLFAAVSVGWGLFAAQLTSRQPSYGRWFIGGMLVLGLAVLLTNFLGTDLRSVPDYRGLHREEQAYRSEVELLRSTPGAVLVEIPSVGFDAGKDVVFDPFWGTELIVTGRLPEHVLTDRIKAKDFSVIALRVDLDEMRRRTGALSRRGPISARTLTGRWTDNTLAAIVENYRLLGHWYSYIYVPKSRP